MNVTTGCRPNSIIRPNPGRPPRTNSTSVRSSTASANNPESTASSRHRRLREELPGQQGRPRRTCSVGAVTVVAPPSAASSRRRKVTCRAGRASGYAGRAGSRR
nr:unnamed protein product [Callosobruchus chinensis]